MSRVTLRVTWVGFPAASVARKTREFGPSASAKPATSNWFAGSREMGCPLTVTVAGSLTPPTSLTSGSVVTSPSVGNWIVRVGGMTSGPASVR